jgi:DNA-binding transcriptional ArsR family regulator
MARAYVGGMEPDVAALASLLADPTRAAAIGCLMSGRAHTAGELARACKVAPATMSAHLSRLLDAAAVEVRPQGSHRYYRLVDPKVARAYEALSALSPSAPPSSLSSSLAKEALGRARTCYDHLAGQLGCALMAALVEAGHLGRSSTGFSLSATGSQALVAAGVDVAGARGRRRRFAYPCLDWTERRDHLGGSLAAALLSCAVTSGWVRTRPGNRAVDVTDTGRVALREHFNIHPTTELGRPDLQ